jgi:hypothetical protein
MDTHCAYSIPEDLDNQGVCDMSNSTRTPDLSQQEWAQAADQAQAAAASAGKMARHAGAAIGALASQAAGDLGQEVDALTTSAGAHLHELGNQLSAHAPQSGLLGSASQGVARAAQNGGDSLEGAKVAGLTEGVAQLIRRNPLPAFFVGIGLGLLVARKLRL